MDRYMAILHWSLDSSGASAYRAAHPGRRFADRFRARLRDHRVWMIGIGVVALGMTVVLLINVPKQFFPDTDSDYSIIKVEMVPGTTLEQTEQMVDQVYAVLHKQQEVKVALQSIKEANANIFINLRKDRERDSITFERELTPILQRIPDARVSFQETNQTGPGGGGSGRAISVMLSGANPEVLAQTAQTLVEQMNGIKDLVAPRISGDMQRPEIVVTPNLDLAASLGVSTQALSQVIRIATLGEIDQNSAKFSLNDRQVPIRVKLPIASRRDLSTIADLPVPTANGGSVPLSRVAMITFGSGPTTIQRYNLSRRIFVGADLRPGAAKGDADIAIKKLPIMANLPEGVSNAPAGQDRLQAEAMRDFSIALTAGIALVFSVLVLLYRRVISPLVNMGSLFLAPLGGMLLLTLTGQVMSLPVFIGLLMLFGIVAKNSILLIDFAIEEMSTGKDKLESIIEAGHKRAQPIVMTTVAMVAGMVPTALAIGGDSGWRAPMGTVVIGGLVLSTALTLLIVPAAFSLADGLEARLGPYMRRMLLTYKPEHGEEAQFAPQAGGAPPRPEVHPAE
jgi:multidrug efflux pump subunit AcrB